MQPESTEVTQKPFNASTPDTQFSSQHGYHCHNGPAASLLQEDRASGDDTTPAPGASAPDSASISEPEHNFHQRQRRVSSTSSKSSRRTGSPVDRIIEHEQAVVSLQKRRYPGPAFTVTRRRSPGDSRLTLTDFPNGESLCTNPRTA